MYVEFEGVFDELFTQHGSLTYTLTPFAIIFDDFFADYLVEFVSLTLQLITEAGQQALEWFAYNEK